MEDDKETLLCDKKLLESTQGRIIGEKPLNWNGFYSVYIDSRSVEKASLFIALYGAVHNGHVYVPQALHQGASAVLIADDEYSKNTDYWLNLAQEWKNVLCIVVKDTLKALQDIAAEYINQFPELLRIGITGSSGKTTTKEITGAIFSIAMPTVMNEGNFNTETGLPLSVFRIRKEHKVGIFEMGMDHVGEISALAKVLRPHLALITNIGTAHIGILGSKLQIAKEKKAIFSCFTQNDKGFIPKNDEFTEFLLEDTIPTTISTWDFDSLCISSICNNGLKGSIFKYEDLDIHFPLPGLYNLKNAVAAIILAKSAGLTAQQIKKGLESVKPLFGRGEVFEGAVTVIQDCYNSNPDSFFNALTFCDELDWHGRKIYLIADMRELGSESIDAHKQVGSLLIHSTADIIILFGEEIKYAYDIISVYQNTSILNKEIIYATKIEDVICALNKCMKKDDLVFLKGSRAMQLERVTSVILQWNEGYR